MWETLFSTLTCPNRTAEIVSGGGNRKGEKKKRKNKRKEKNRKEGE
jgi:hypothetical protein